MRALDGSPGGGETFGEHGCESVDAFVAERYVPLLRLARVLVGHRQQAEDLVQDVLASVVLRWRRVRATDDRAAYTNRMLVNAATSWRRRPARRESAAVLDEDRAAADPSAATETRVALVAALRELPVRHRAVLALRYLEDWPDDDIADALGIAPSTVRSCARRGLAALRTSGVLDGYGPRPPGQRPRRRATPATRATPRSRRRGTALEASADGGRNASTPRAPAHRTA